MGKMQQLLVLLVIAYYASVPVAAAARALLTTDCAAWADNLDLLTGVDIPAEIAVPDGNVLHTAIQADGYQNYEFNGTAWVLANATAKLYNSGNDTDQVGRHFFLPEPDALGGRPTWESIDECQLPVLISAVTARSLVAKTVDSDSITWNLLIATSHYGNTQEPLGLVTYVQRLKTQHGLAPTSTEGANIGDIHSTEYYAIYAFYVQSIDTF